MSKCAWLYPTSDEPIFYLVPSTQKTVYTLFFGSTVTGTQFNMLLTETTDKQQSLYIAKLMLEKKRCRYSLTNLSRHGQALRVGDGGQLLVPQPLNGVLVIS